MFITTDYSSQSVPNSGCTAVAMMLYAEYNFTQEVGNETFECVSIVVGKYYDTSATGRSCPLLFHK